MHVSVRPMDFCTFKKNSPWCFGGLLWDFTHLISKLMTSHEPRDLKDTFVSILRNIWPFRYNDQSQTAVTFWHQKKEREMPDTPTHESSSQLVSASTSQHEPSRSRVRRARSVAVAALRLLIISTGRTHTLRMTQENDEYRKEKELASRPH